MDCINNNYKHIAVCDKIQNHPKFQNIAKGGVALLWHRKYNDNITPLHIDDDRIVGVKIELN